MKLKAKGFSKVYNGCWSCFKKKNFWIYEKFGLQVAVLSHAELDSKANFQLRNIRVSKMKIFKIFFIKTIYLNLFCKCKIRFWDSF